MFQCGKCKKQFSSIDVFVNHKTECNNSANQISDITLPTNICGLPPNAVVLQKIEVSFIKYSICNIIHRVHDIKVTFTTKVL